MPNRKFIMSKRSHCHPGTLKLNTKMLLEVSSFESRPINLNTATSSANEQENIALINWLQFMVYAFTIHGSCVFEFEAYYVKIREITSNSMMYLHSFDHILVYYWSEFQQVFFREAFASNYSHLF